MDKAVEDQGVAATPPGYRPSDGAASTGVSTVPASIPNAWFPVQGRLTGAGDIPSMAPDALIYARGRFGDVYGPLPFEMFADEAWRGNMFHGSHDLVGWAPASGIDARRAETGTGSVHESPVGNAETPKVSHP